MMTTISVILRVINFLLMIGIPFFLVLMIFRRGKSGFRPIWIGAAAFIFSQVLHIPFNQFLMLPFLEARGIAPSAPEGAQLVLLGVAAGLSAGVFEEVTRYLVLRFFLRKEQEELLPVKYGLGHGGIEAILAGLLALAAFVQVLALGGEGALSSFEPDEVLLIQSQLETYWTVPWQQLLLGAWERVSALAFHVGASIFVYLSVVKKKPTWLIIAIIGHTVLDAFVVIAVNKIDLVLLEGILFIFALGWFGWAWLVRIKDPGKEEEIKGDVPDLPSITPQITPEQIEESRYDE
jgi:uncharacterized membrane protein YhfC